MILLHKFLAKLTGEFWASCPKCHTHFGGHQGIVHDVKIKGENYRYVCKPCHEEDANENNNSKSI